VADSLATTRGRPLEDIFDAASPARSPGMGLKSGLSGPEVSVVCPHAMAGTNGAAPAGPGSQKNR